MTLVVDTKPLFRSLNSRLRAAAAAAAVSLGEQAATHIKEAMLKEETKDTGNTAQSVRSEPVAREVQPGVFRVIVAPSAAQMAPAKVLEKGRRPGFGVSKLGRKKIASWLRKKGSGFLAKIEAEVAARRAAKKAAAGKGPRKPKDPTKGKVQSVREEALETAVEIVVNAIARRGLPRKKPKGFQFFKAAGEHIKGKGRQAMLDALRRIPGGRGRGVA